MGAVGFVDSFAVPDGIHSGSGDLFVFDGGATAACGFAGRVDSDGFEQVASDAVVGGYSVVCRVVVVGPVVFGDQLFDTGNEGLDGEFHGFYSPSPASFIMSL